ncbi:MAG: glycosyltransferase [Candidatus Latescibacteria bacterium]|nr:glycosyltransferase [Candidatus Latescibacterota bacterium]
MKITFLVNDTRVGVMGLRARNFASYLAGSAEVNILYRESGKFEALKHFVRSVSENRPDLLYVMNVGYAGGGAALWALIRYGIPFVIDHGDPSYLLLKSSGRPFWEAWLVGIAEATMLRRSALVVARGSWLADELSRKWPDRVFFIPDGVETDTFKPIDVTALRQSLGLQGPLTIGVVGSIVWSERFQMCYGWDVIEAVRLLKEHRITGIIVGDGDGIPHLKERVAAYGIEDLIHFAGRVAHSEVPNYINLMDVCISTQTNDSVGKSRTTAKLPEYLACGRFVIATDVGGAREVVHENGFLLPYHQGVHDAQHPQRLAEKLLWLMENPDALKNGMAGIPIARERYEYQQLARRLQNALSTVGLT